MPLENISTFSAALKGGLRGNKFKVLMTLPSGVSGDMNVFSLMIRSTTVPAMETGVIEVPYKGQQIKLSGDVRPAGDWTFTAFLNNGQSAANAKRIAQKWQELSGKEKDPTRYKSTATLQLLDPVSGGIIMSWKLEGIWVSNSGEINLSEDSVDEILTLDVTVNYDKVTAL